MEKRKEISKIKMLLDIFIYVIFLCISILLIYLYLFKIKKINNFLVIILLALILWGFINNLFNFTYYCFFAQEKNSINNDTYVYEKNISRFNILDYTKKNTRRKIYGFYEWKYYSEYRLHQFFWYILKRYYNDKKHPYLSKLASSAHSADIVYKESDSRPIVNIFVYIVGLFGI